MANHNFVVSGHGNISRRQQRRLTVVGGTRFNVKENACGSSDGDPALEDDPNRSIARRLHRDHRIAQFLGCASLKNDDNLVVVRGNAKLAQAYALHINGIYDRCYGPTSPATMISSRVVALGTPSSRGTIAARDEFTTGVFTAPPPPGARAWTPWCAPPHSRTFSFSPRLHSRPVVDSRQPCSRIVSPLRA
jgi:hypothetical protein